MSHREKKVIITIYQKMRFIVFSILMSFLIIGCATTPEKGEYQKNKQIIDSAIQEGKPKPVINPTTAVISETIRRR